MIRTYEELALEAVVCAASGANLFVSETEVMMLQLISAEDWRDYLVEQGICPGRAWLGS